MKVRNYYGEIVNNLFELGFPIYDKGCRYYANIVNIVANYISSVGNDTDKLLWIIYELKNPNSEFYEELAILNHMKPDDLHKLLQNLIDNIDYDNMNEALYKKLFCRIYEDIDYGEYAFVIASSILNKNVLDTYINENKPLIRHLAKDE